MLSLLLTGCRVPRFEFERVNRIPIVALNCDAKQTHAIGDTRQRPLKSASVKASAGRRRLARLGSTANTG
mgnify:CR=1 FL=1